ncbi:MAG: DNA-binding protein [Acidimicrobiia bacterium]|nr:DNA-binding protein [Acidimicrobiia bacterium]
MQKFLLATLLALAASAQVSKVEIVKPTTPHDDSKPNSAAVPEAIAIDGKIERVVVIRLKFNADLLAGIESTIKQHKIKNAVVLNGIGSVRNYHIHSVSNRTFPSKNIFIKDPSAPADIISINGFVIDGRLHAHMTLTTGEHAFGGHIEPGTNVFTFAILTLGILPDSMDISRVDDKTYR